MLAQLQRWGDTRLKGRRALSERAIPLPELPGELVQLTDPGSAGVRAPKRKDRSSQRVRSTPAKAQTNPPACPYTHTQTKLCFTWTK